MKTFANLDDFAGAAGTDLGTTDWLTVDQHRIDLFAEATDDRQWIHIDPERAAGGPFGTTIAHGLLTLSLVPVFMQDLYRVEGISLAVNYGFNKVRFIAPVPVGAKLRASGSVAEVMPVTGGMQGVFGLTLEIDGSAKPACVLESIIRFIA